MQSHTWSLPLRFGDFLNLPINRFNRFLRQECEDFKRRREVVDPTLAITTKVRSEKISWSFCPVHTAQNACITCTGSNQACILLFWSLLTLLLFPTIEDPNRYTNPKPAKALLLNNTAWSERAVTCQWEDFVTTPSGFYYWIRRLLQSSAWHRLMTVSYGNWRLTLPEVLN